MGARGAQRIGVVTALAGSTAAAIALALPFAASGRRWRSAYALLRLVRDLDIAGGVVAGAFVLCVTLVPVLAAGAWVAAALRARRTAITLGVAVGLLALFTASAVERSPLRPGTGLRMAQAAGAVALLGVATLVVHEPAAPSRRAPRP